MASRPIWRGHVRLALVSCPVALYSASQDRGNLHFHFINPATGHRVRMQTLDAETGEELNRGALSRGYEFRKGEYLILDEEDFESARIPSSSTITIDKFVRSGDIDPIYYDQSYFMVPDGDAGADVYAVLREAIVKSGKAAFARVVISRRERAIAIVPMDRGMVAHTLHEEKDIADPKALFDGVPDVKPDPEMVKLATLLIDRQTGRYDPADMEDRYEARLRDVIDAKLRGEGIEPEQEAEPDRGNVIDLMAALKRSLGQTASPASAAKPARKQAAHSAPAKSAPTKSAPAKSRAPDRAAKKAPKAGSGKTPARKRA